MFSKSRFNNTADDSRYERKIKNRTIVWKLVLINISFLSRGDILDCLRVGWNWPELRDRLTMLVIVGTRTEAHFLRSQVGIGSESDCLLRQLRRIFEISDWVAGLKVEKLRTMVNGAGEWGHNADWLLSIAYLRRPLCLNKMLSYRRETALQRVH